LQGAGGGRSPDLKSRRSPILAPLPQTSRSATRQLNAPNTRRC
jgi:hypothetical protein